MKRIIIGFYCLACAFVVPAQQVLTLENCRQMALENNKRTLIAEKTAEKADLDKKAAAANFFPKFSASGMYLYTNTSLSRTIAGGYLPTFVPGPDGSLQPNLMMNGGVPVTADGSPVFNQYAYFPDMTLDLKMSGTYTAGLKVEQPVYTGGKILAANRMTEIGKDISQLNIRLTRTEIIVVTDEAYWNCVRAGELLKSAMKYKEVVAELHRNVENACQAGLKPVNDVLKVQVKLNEAELLVRRTHNAVRLAKMNLCYQIGLPLESDIEPGESLPETVAVLRPETSDITLRPEYGILTRQIELQHQQKKMVLSEFLPNIGVMATYGYVNGLKLNGEKLLSNGCFSALLSVNIPLFHWGEGRNKVRSARVATRIMELKRDDAELKMELELTQAMNAVDESQLEVELTTKSLTQAEENLKVSRNQYEVGMETLADYLEAQTSWQKAWSDMINAKACLKFNETSYLKAAGKLE